MLFGIAVAVTITFKAVYNRIYDKKVDFAGDNAVYFMLGKAISGGHGYRNMNDIKRSLHNHFPPGYPVIIAGIFKIFPDTFNSVKSANGLFMWASVILMLLIARKITGDIIIASLAAGLMLLNNHLLKFSTIMMSEMSFLLLTLTFIFIFTGCEFKKQPHRNIPFLILLLICAFAYHVRSLGLSLAGAFVLFFLIHKNWKYLIATSVGFILLTIPWIAYKKN